MSKLEITIWVIIFAVLTAAALGIHSAHPCSNYDNEPLQRVPLRCFNQSILLNE
jgi:hypothetical protein